MAHQNKQWFQVVACLIFTLAIGSANAKPSTSKTSFGSFSKPSSTAPAHIAPLAPTRSASPATSFGSFKSSPAQVPLATNTTAAPAQSSKAVVPPPDKMTADMQANAAKANALKAYDQRNTATSSTATAGGIGSSATAPTYSPVQMQQPAPPPTVIYQNNSGGGLGSIATGFMLGRMLSPSHTYNNGTNRDYPSNISTNEQRSEWDSANSHQSYFPWGLFILIAVIIAFALYFWRKRSAGSDGSKAVRYTL